MMQRATIAVVSDVSLGYGSPQVGALARSLSEHFGATAMVYEPDQSQRPPCLRQHNGMDVQRIATDVTPYSLSGRIQYLTAVARRLNALRPAIVAMMNTYCLPALAKLNYRPRQTVYVLSEMIAPYGRLAEAMNRWLGARIDLIVFPEANRARIDAERCMLTGIPTAVLYNCADAPEHPAQDIEKRLPRLYYGGAINVESGVAGMLLHRSMRDLPVDVYGDVTGASCATILRRFERHPGLHYHGCVDADALRAARRERAYSLVMYRPTSESTRYAAPNKFFEAIADGVPPIATPHPQCREIVQRYRCGIVARDWSTKAYGDAVKRGMDMLGTRRYARLVENCVRATREELNWKRQFEKVTPLLTPAA
jgi:hypothetical protein